MSTVLHIDASVAGAASQSRAATARIVADLAPSRVIRRDTANDPLPFIDDAWAQARLVPADQATDADRATLALSDTLVAELEAADTIVIGFPMFNFGLPANLKAWIDLVARPKRTFRYTENGPEGLLTGKRAIIVMASGGVPLGAPVDFASPHLVQLLNFIGITDVEVRDAATVTAAKAA